MKAIDITAQKFGRLTVLYRLRNYHKKGVWWLCVCDCGNLTETQGTMLRSGHNRSCGCLQKEQIHKACTKHGKRGTRLYTIWQGMKQRCYNKNSPRYKDYGKRGIKVCEEWLNFQTFYDWSMLNGYKNSLTIDRIDNEGNYEPDNCQWVDYKTQNRNRRNNINIDINGMNYCLTDLCKKSHLKYSTVRWRLMHGWTINKALELEVNNGI